VIDLFQGSSVAITTFYPFETARTRLQGKCKTEPSFKNGHKHTETERKCP